MNDGHRTAACSLLRARLLLCGFRLMMDFGKAVFRHAEHGRTGSFTQAAGNTAASFDCNVHTDTLLSEIQFAPFPMIYAFLRAKQRWRMPPKPPAATVQSFAVMVCPGRINCST